MANDVTQYLNRLRDGDASALESLFDEVYGELRVVADRAYAHSGSPQTLQPTAIVHEAWLKLAGHVQDIECRRHFFAVSARAMRQVLTDHARAVRAKRRGGDNQRVTMLMEPEAAQAGGDVDIVALDDALQRLSELNERHGKVVELRFLGGLSIRETAEELGVSHGTVESDWAMAKAWLRRALATG